MCAERRHIEKLIYIARKKGVPEHGIVRWIHRHEGEFIILRKNRLGEDATSLPCILCRRAMEKYKIKWKAYFKDRWICSSDIQVPPSLPTSRQAFQVFRTKGLKK
jgi:hypothetical protein